MDVERALDLLSDGHTILPPECAEEVCQAVGVPFERDVLVQRWHSDPPGIPLGLTMNPEHEGSEGVFSLTLSRHVAEKLADAEEAGSFHGRGFQARAYAEAIGRKLHKGG